MRTDLERWSQLDRHGRHEMVRLERHQGLPVDLLLSKVLDVLPAAGQVLDKVADLGHVPLERVAAGAGERLLLGRSGGGGERSRDRSTGHGGLLQLHLLLRRLYRVGFGGVVSFGGAGWSTGASFHGRPGVQVFVFSLLRFPPSCR